MPWGKFTTIVLPLVAIIFTAYQWFATEQKLSESQARLNTIQSETIKNKAITESLEKEKKELEEWRDQDSTTEEQRGMIGWEIDGVKDKILKERDRFRDKITDVSAPLVTDEDVAYENPFLNKKAIGGDD